MPCVLVTGANRGLGLEFCRQYAETGWLVLACCRKPEQAAALRELAEQHGNLQILPLQVTDFAAIDSLSQQLAKASIDVLINNAGIYGDHAQRAFGHLDYENWNRTLRINLQAPVKMAEAFLPQVQRSAKKLLVAISSQMGCISDNSSGGSLLYRSSKAGLNAVMKSLSIDLAVQKVGVLIFHPGWVRTDMGGAQGLIDAATSVAGMRQQIEQFDIRHSGRFIKYDGTTMSW